MTQSTVGIVSAPAVRRVAVCADDFGLSEGASKSIVELARLGAITSTSCIVDGPSNGRYGEELKSVKDFAIGLHLNLVEGDAPYRRVSLSRLVVRAYIFGFHDRAALRTEIARQFDCFEKWFGQAPAFVDGHQHAHQLPGVGEELLVELQRRYGARVAVRSTVPLLYRGVKATLISSLGGRRFSIAAKSRGMPMNRDFGGVYRFTQQISFSRRMETWIKNISDLGLIMCHPQLPPGNTAFRKAGAAEYEFLKSAEWREMQSQIGICPVPFDSIHFGNPVSA